MWHKLGNLALFVPRAVYWAVIAAGALVLWVLIVLAAGDMILRLEEWHE